jgi:hypothetical protein
MDRTLVIASSSLESVLVPVSNVNGTDLSALPVQMAFTPGEPAGGDWKSATWTTLTNPTRYLASCLVGPGGTVTLAEGTYQVWVKVTATPEIPVKLAGFVVVT